MVTNPVFYLDGQWPDDYYLGRGTYANGQRLPSDRDDLDELVDWLGDEDTLDDEYDWSD